MKRLKFVNIIFIYIISSSKKKKHLRNFLFLKAQGYTKIKHSTEVVELKKWFIQLISLFLRVQRIPAGDTVEMSLVWFQENLQNL